MVSVTLDGLEPDQEKLMPYTGSMLMSSFKIWTVAFAMIGAASVPIAHAEESDAKRLLKSMSDYLASQQSISFEYDTSFEVVSKDHQKVALASSGTVTLSRPDKLRATRHGGFANVEFVFDGKTVSMVGKDANVFIQADVPGSVDHLVDELRDKFYRPLPGADLLMSDVYAQLMPLVKDVKDLGSGIIRDMECDHLAFRTQEFDWQIWIAQGDRPYPCRYVITTTQVEGWPQYTLDIRNWKTGSDVAGDDFKFVAPAGAQKLEKGDVLVLDVDELPSSFTK
jgi:hypothetical protein